MRALIVVVLLGFAHSSFSQNKTLGVGTPTPNPNAALHVESPTGNQGFIMPRLTTAQRTSAGFTSILNAADNGLMVYDSDEKVLYIWDGTAWKSSQQVAQANLALQANQADHADEADLADEAVKLVLPYIDTTTTMPNNSNIISVVHNGTGVENVGVAKFENLNPDNGYNPLYVRNFGTNGTAYFQVVNPNSMSTSLRSFTNSDQPGVGAIQGGSSGTGGPGGIFQISNAASNYPALTSFTLGTGPAGRFEIDNAGSTAPAISIVNNGSGNAITTTGNIEAGQFIGDGSLLTNLPGGGGGWGLSGNSGTAAPTNFIGTLDNTDLLFRTNNTDRLTISKGGGLSVLNGHVNLGTGYSMGINPTADFFTSPVGNFGNYALGWVNDAWQGSGATGYLSGWGGLKFFTFSTTMPRLAINTWGQIGINNDTPGAMLDIDGDLLLRQISAPGVTTDKLYNVSGNLFWNGANISSGGSGWSLTGNTLGGTETIGSNNSQPLVFKTNNTERVRIDAGGKVGIGTSPAYKLDVAGTTQIVNTNPGLRAMEITSTVGDAVNITASGTGNTKAILASATATGNYATGLFSEATADAGQIAMGVQSTAQGTGTLNYGVQANATGAATTNYGLFANAANGTTNWAGYFNNGNVHIKNALSFGTTDGTYGSTGQVLTSQGSANAPEWKDLFPQGVVLSNTLPVIDLTNSGTGMAATFSATNGSQTIYSSNTGTGKAGTFGNNSSTLAAVDAFNSGTGPALSLSSLTNNLAIDMQQGGVKYSYLPVSAGGSITSKAGVYGITTSVTVSLPSAVNGETCIACAIGAVTPTVEGTVFIAGQCRVFVYTAPGTWRVVN